MLDFDITRCSRKCTATGREIKPGEIVHSVLVQQGSEISRQDYCEEAWSGPPDECIGWWTTRIPQVQSSGQKMAPPAVLVQLFDQLTHSDDQPELRFVLALLLIRKKLLREETVDEESSQRQWTLRCPLNEETYRVEVLQIGAARAASLQQELVQLLYGEAHPESESREASETD